ncbi:cellular nucleic acid-binding protein, partial [Trifolium medium]|nr:cellular nucleic acid-binding protein [Trifolium medium]
MCCREVARSVKAQEDVFVLFALMTVEEKTEVDAFPVVREFVDVFPEDIVDLPPEREVEFSIDI